MRDRLAVAELGATFLGGLVGDVSIPRRTGIATAYWFGADDSDSVTESTGTIGTVTMTPKTVGALSKFSHLMNLQSTPDIEQLIRADFVALLADAIDTAAINGSGSSNQPTGILNTTGIGSVAGGTNGLAPMLDYLLDLKQEVAVDNAGVASCGYLTNAKSSPFLPKPRIRKASTSSALMELNLAVARLQGGVLRSATTSPQTPRRVLGPTSRLLFMGTLQTC